MTTTYFRTVRNYLVDLGYLIADSFEADGVLLVENEQLGIKNLMIGVAEPVLVMEQFLFEMNGNDPDLYKKLLQQNRNLVHGAFALDESGRMVVFRDTLELENLDINELEGSLNSLSLMLSEFADDLIAYSKAE